MRDYSTKVDDTLVSVGPTFVSHAASAARAEVLQCTRQYQGITDTIVQ
jgi:hypothetical protein